MKLGDLQQVLKLEAERSRIVSHLQAIEFAGQVVLILGDQLCEPELAASVAKPLRHELACRLASNGRKLRALGVTID